MYQFINILVCCFINLLGLGHPAGQRSASAPSLPGPLRPHQLTALNVVITVAATPFDETGGDEAVNKLINQ